jgi:tetratricopeptide (TPR) repeat protein
MKVLPVRLLILFFILISALFQAAGQEKGSPKAVKYFEKAKEYLQKGEWEDCKSELKKTIQADSTKADAYIMMGDVLLETGNPQEAAWQYAKALKFNPEHEDIVIGLVANTLFSLERYAEAIPYYEKILAIPGIDAGLKAYTEEKVSEARFRKDLMDHPVSFDPVDLGPAVNSNADEYINALAADGSGIYFTRRTKNTGNSGRDFNEDFYFAGFHGDSLEMAAKLNYPPGKENDAGGLCISPDGRLLFFTCCFRADRIGSCDLYFSEKTGDKWSAAKNMGRVVNTESWEAQPSISPDGKTLYFASNRNGGKGSSDIWKTERAADGSWSKPVNLGSPVNTASSEMAPFIHYDNKTLYFSSGGHQGMGGADLFKSTREANSWSNPQNLGYPINSADDELVIVVSPEGNLGYISSFDKSSGMGYDIFRFEMSDVIKPDPVTYLKGKVYDRDSGIPLGAKFTLIDIASDSIIIESVSDRINGEFLVCLPGNRDYALNVSCNGYLFYSDHFPLSEIKTSLDPVLKDIPLEPVAIGNSMILRNIFYETDQYVLKPESYPELNELFDFLKANPSLRIEVGGHTDNVGTAAYNVELSTNRAHAVSLYLENAGLDASRVTFKGYGESKPVGNNETEEGRAMNRRTEITIIK